MTRRVLLQRFARRQSVDTSGRIESRGPLIDEADIDEFLTTASAYNNPALDDILDRAIAFALPSGDQDLGKSFIKSSAALESILTFFRRQDDFDILAAEEFGELERDLKKWLKQHPVLANEPTKRGLIYEKVPELNRFPFSFVFRKFCEHYSLDLGDLWPVTGKHAEWPLMEVRHRLVHGDPFLSRPVEALACAEAHLGWAVERMLLCVLGWPIARSNVSADFLQRTRGEHQSWQIERAKFA